MLTFSEDSLRIGNAMGDAIFALPAESLNSQTKPLLNASSASLLSSTFK